LIELLNKQVNSIKPLNVPYFCFKGGVLIPTWGSCTQTLRWPWCRHLTHGWRNIEPRFRLMWWPFISVQNQSAHTVIFTWMNIVDPGRPNTYGITTNSMDRM